VASNFDVTAATFDRYRDLPKDAPETIRKKISDAVGSRSLARVLDLGAGTGRIGKAFVQAGDCYVGADLSLPMLREFRARSAAASLVQADGQRLPFRDGTFTVVLLMQVLSGAHDWRSLLCEVMRVLAPAGAVVVGHTTAPSTGVDAQLKRQLGVVLEQMGITSHRPNKSRSESLSWLETRAARWNNMAAAAWTAERTPREFLARHRTGARFAALPVAVQEEALVKLTAWAEETFGSLDAVFFEERGFALDIFEFVNQPGPAR
jgi:ubiquinone/menaquinone biosynthesis C-methylase UbiE